MTSIPTLKECQRIFFNLKGNEARCKLRMWVLKEK